MSNPDVGLDVEPNVALAVDAVHKDRSGAERKALVDLISKDAVKHIPELSSHVTDGRWYA